MASKPTSFGLVCLGNGFHSRNDNDVGKCGGPRFWTLSARVVDSEAGICRNERLVFPDAERLQGSIQLDIRADRSTDARFECVAVPDDRDRDDFGKSDRKTTAAVDF